jgi:CheY-like chemotaxis protein
MTAGPIVLIEDDKDDQEIFADAVQAIGIRNELLFFDNGTAALEYLTTTEEQPFIIISDVNMPGMSGLQLKHILNDDPYLSAKGIPFVFFSTDASNVAVRHAHALSVQGFFQKPTGYDALIKLLSVLFEYWALCKHINNT